MFYASISQEVKTLAKTASTEYLRGNAKDADKLLIEFAPYIIGFQGVWVDYPDNEFHDAIGDRSWELTDITDEGFFFNGVDEETKENRVLFIPVSKLMGVQFLFRDAQTYDTPPQEMVRPWMYRNGGSWYWE